jgi:hypothetical protein
MNIPTPKTGNLQIGTKQIKLKFNVDFVETGLKRRANFFAVRNLTIARGLCTNKIKQLFFLAIGMHFYMSLNVPGSVTLTMIGVYFSVNKTQILGDVWLSSLRR